MSDIDYQCEYAFVQEYFGHMDSRRCFNAGNLTLHHGRRLCSRHFDLTVTELFICSKCNRYRQYRYWHNEICGDCIDRFDLLPENWGLHCALVSCDKCCKLGNAKTFRRHHTFWTAKGVGWHCHNGNYCNKCWKVLKAAFRRMDKRAEDVTECRSLIRKIKENINVHIN
jgi:hypothetical protein